MHKHIPLTEEERDILRHLALNEMNILFFEHYSAGHDHTKKMEQLHNIIKVLDKE